MFRSHVSLFLAGYNQDPYPGATGDIDARYSQREGERDKAVQSGHRKLPGTSAENTQFTQTNAHYVSCLLVLVLS